MKKGEWMWKEGVYETNNQPKKATFNYKQEIRLCLGLAKVESKEDGKITGKRCTVFDYTGQNFFHDICLQKINHKWIRKNKEAYFAVVAMDRFY